MTAQTATGRGGLRRAATALVVGLGLVISGAASAHADTGYVKYFGLDSKWRIQISTTAAGTVDHWVDSQAKTTFKNGVTQVKRGSSHAGGRYAYAMVTGTRTAASASASCPTSSCPV